MSHLIEQWAADEGCALRSAVLRAQDEMAVGDVPRPLLALAAPPGRVPVRRAGRWIPLLAAAAVVATAMTAGLITWPGVVTAPGHDAVLSNDPPTGSLAGRTATLSAIEAAFRQQVPEARESHLALATDVAGARLALVQWRDGPSVRATWLVGTPDAPVRSMTTGDECAPTAVCWTRYGEGFSFTDDVTPDGTVPATTDRREGVVVAAPRGSRVVVRAGNDVTRDGTVLRTSVTAHERWSGVFDAPLPMASGRLDVQVTDSGGSTIRDWSYAGSSLDPDVWWSRASTGLRGTPVSDGPTVRGDLSLALRQATLLPPSRRDRVLWSTGGVSDRAVVALRAVSGGWVLAAVMRRQEASDSFTTRVQGVRPMPDLDLDRVTFAWHEVDRIRILAPPVAVRCRIQGQGRALDVSMDKGVGTAALPSARDVTCLDRTGHVVGRSAVTPEWHEGDVVAP